MYMYISKLNSIERQANKVIGGNANLKTNEEKCLNVNGKLCPRFDGYFELKTLEIKTNS